jgi:endonuclease/exonuclease/phosphatase (EEP) superfamily protein YafD
MLYGLHPEPPSPSEADSSLPRDAELVMAGREIVQSHRPALVAGDLNDVAWSHTAGCCGA